MHFFYFFGVIHLMCEYHQGLSMIGFKFNLIFHSQYSAMIVYETLKLTLMNGAERERFCGVLLSCFPTLCFIKYLVSSVSNQ